MKMRFVRIVLNCAIVLAVCSFAASCSDEDGEVSEYENWQERNDSYLLSIRTLALDSMRIAKSRYGNNWEEKCNWRSYLSYKFDATVPHNGNDSAYIQILRRGQGSEVSPYLNDSVRIYYRAHLIPSSSYPEGQVILHSGQSSLYNDIFNVKTGVPATKKTSSFPPGVTTALLHMHVGDFWRIYVPYNIGYGTSDNAAVPAYSTLIFEVQLVAFFRNGTPVSPWN